MVYVISKSGKPLMPTEKYAMVRRFLKRGRAHVVSRESILRSITQ
ncbi:MAG: RRXRR domain-containing protein [Alistipes sp.]|nr:RRXRR domain-containing protein [Candidatus Alistipes equi]